MEPKTYQQVHAGLFYERGKASDYPCVGGCGRPGREWAYQYNAGDAEIRDENGKRPYSENLRDHYAPMCRRCHMAFDMENDPASAEWQERWRKHGGTLAASRQARIQSDPEFAQKMRETYQHVGQVHATRIKEDPEYAEEVRGRMRRVTATHVTTEQFKERALKCISMRRRCSDCGYEGGPPHLGNHLKFTGHTGWVAVEPVP